eukprot:1022483-Prymnesium_polylepis.1
MALRQHACSCNSMLVGARPSALTNQSVARKRRQGGGDFSIELANRLSPSSFAKHSWPWASSPSSPSGREALMELTEYAMRKTAATGGAAANWVWLALAPCVKACSLQPSRLVEMRLASCSSSGASRRNGLTRSFRLTMPPYQSYCAGESTGSAQSLPRGPLHGRAPPSPSSVLDPKRAASPDPLVAEPAHPHLCESAKSNAALTASPKRI